MSKVSGQFSVLVKVPGATVGVNTTAYADNDLVGELITLPVGKSGLIQTLTLQDLTAQNAALEVLVFDQNPSGTTWTNNSAVDVVDADLPKCCAMFKVAAGDYITLADNSVGTVKGLAIPFVTENGNLYIALRSDAATPTYAASELSLTFGLLVDLGL